LNGTWVTIELMTLFSRAPIVWAVASNPTCFIRPTLFFSSSTIETAIVVVSLFEKNPLMSGFAVMMSLVIASALFRSLSVYRIVMSSIPGKFFLM
jgi:hypothetical protein